MAACSYSLSCYRTGKPLTGLSSSAIRSDSSIWNVPSNGKRTMQIDQFTGIILSVALNVSVVVVVRKVEGGVP